MLLGIFVVYPIIAVVFYSFTDYDIVRPPVPVGLANYQKLIADPTFWLALQHSFVYLIVTPILIVLSIILAIIVNRAAARDPHLPRAVLRAGGQRQHRHRPRLDAGCSSATASSTACCSRGASSTQPVQWLATPALVLPIAMLLTIWAGVGFYSVIFLAGLQNIPEELYDAARIDGCNDFQKHRYVSLPGLRPQIVFVAVISSLAALKVFDEIYVLTNRTGGILDSGMTIVFYLWKQAFQLQPRGVRVGDRDRAAGDHARVLDRQRPDPRARAGGRMSRSPMRELERAGADHQGAPSRGASARAAPRRPPAGTWC